MERSEAESALVSAALLSDARAFSSAAARASISAAASCSSRSRLSFSRRRAPQVLPAPGPAPLPVRWPPQCPRSHAAAPDALGHAHLQGKFLVGTDDLRVPVLDDQTQPSENIFAGTRQGSSFPTTYCGKRQPPSIRFIGRLEYSVKAAAKIVKGPTSRRRRFRTPGSGETPTVYTP